MMAVSVAVKSARGSTWFSLQGAGRPVLGSSIVPRKEGILRPNGALDSVIVDLDTAVGQEELQSLPVFCNVGQGLAEWGLVAIRAQ
ncbi:hypothetical protein A6U98_00185 [Rhizobium sp. WYCCWR10014]|nr:hypothetical protein A6U98_00185 [Rhizobium sp. WYCCWR10014]